MSKNTKLAVKMKWIKEILENNKDKQMLLMKVQSTGKDDDRLIGYSFTQIVNEIYDSEQEYMEEDEIVVIDQEIFATPKGLHIMISNLEFYLKRITNRINKKREVTLFMYRPMMIELMKSDNSRILDICFRLLKIIRSKSQYFKLVLIDEDKYQRISNEDDGIYHYLQSRGDYEFYVLTTESIARNANKYKDKDDIKEFMFALEMWDIICPDTVELFKSNNYLNSNPVQHQVSVSESSSSIIDIYDYISTKIVGQDIAVQKVSEVLFNTNSAWRREFSESAVRSVMFFVGPTGTGKTQLASEIAKYTFGNKKNITRFDMANFVHPSDISTIIGTPPGYTGTDRPPAWLERIRENPEQVIIFDEIEKAHVSVIGVLLGILDTGVLNTSDGNEVDLSKAIIIMTSNVGEYGLSPVETISSVLNHFKKIGREELLGRIGRDNIVPFTAFSSNKAKKELVINKISEFESKLLKRLKLNLFYSNDELEQLCYYIMNKVNWRYGARDLQSTIQREMFNTVLNFIQSNKISIMLSEQETSSLRVSFIQDEVKVSKMVRS